MYTVQAFVKNDFKTAYALTPFGVCLLEFLDLEDAIEFALEREGYFRVVHNATIIWDTLIHSRIFNVYLN